MIRHIVMWQFEKNQEETIKKFLIGLDKLKEVIPEIVNLQTGININPENEFNAVLIADFKSMDDLKRYAANPKHTEAAAFGKSLRLKREAIDFEY